MSPNLLTVVKQFLHLQINGAADHSFGPVYRSKKIGFGCVVSRFQSENSIRNTRSDISAVDELGN